MQTLRLFTILLTGPAIARAAGVGTSLLPCRTNSGSSKASRMAGAGAMKPATAGPIRCSSAASTGRIFT